MPWGYPGGALCTRCSTRTRRHMGSTKTVCTSFLSVPRISAMRIRKGTNTYSDPHLPILGDARTHPIPTRFCIQPALAPAMSSKASPLTAALRGELRRATVPGGTRTGLQRSQTALRRVS